jgi:transcription initiation factor TFIID TATA-box-binding protein
MALDEYVTDVFPEDDLPRTNLNRSIPTLTLTRESLKCAKAQVEIQNVVATADLSQRLDLDVILQVTPGARYDPQRFPGLIYRLKKPKTTTLMFKTGKMVCTGAKSSKSAKAAISQVISDMTGNGIIIIARPSVNIENIVASANLQGIVDLENVAEQLYRTMYEPEQFPAVIYRMIEPKVVLLVFANGKIVCTGAKKETDVYFAIEKLQDTLQLNRLITRDDSDRANSTVLLTEAPIMQR